MQCAARASCSWRRWRFVAIESLSRLPSATRSILTGTMQRRTCGFLLALVLGAMSVGCGGTAAQGGGASSAQGMRPPDFQLDTVDGNTVRLGDYLGKKVVLIDFWATYCDPCLASMPHLESLYEKYKDQGLVVLGVSIDGPDSVAQVKTEVAKLGVSFPILLDQETRVVALYNPKTSAPYSVLIGRDGTILFKKEGYTSGGADQLDKDIAAALAKK
jgi:peroxiredoxin